MPRPRKCRCVSSDLVNYYYKPRGVKISELQQVILKHDQLEALKLADAEQMNQEEACKLMNISRSTFSRLVNGARKIVAQALINGWAIKIEEGIFRKNKCSSS